MSKVETHFLVPIYEDEEVGSGELHSRNKWEKLEDDLETEFPGWTLAPGFYTGGYKDPDTGRKVRDMSKMYIVAVDEEVVPKLREYLKEKVATSFRQKVIYFSARGEVEFIESAERHVI